MSTSHGDGDGQRLAATAWVEESMEIESNGGRRRYLRALGVVIVKVFWASTLNSARSETQTMVQQRGLPL
jgi:hypothetical protein